MTFNSLSLEVDDALAIVRLVRPEKRNAITAELRGELAQVVDALTAGEDARDLPVRALLIEAEGDCFCAGGDLKDMNRRRTARMARHRVVNAQRWFSQLVNLEMPVIAAVNGPAIGAGFSIALAADFIVATPRATFTCAFARIGLMPDLSLLYLLPRIVGLQRAKELILGARSITAQEAKEMGIVYDIVHEREFDEAVRDLARRLCKAPPVAIGLSKAILNRSFETGQHSMMELEAMSQGIAVNSDSHHASVDAFLKKKQLEYGGVDRPYQKNI